MMSYYITNQLMASSLSLYMCVLINIMSPCIEYYLMGWGPTKIAILGFIPPTLFWITKKKYYVFEKHWA